VCDDSLERSTFHFYVSQLLSSGVWEPIWFGRSGATWVVVVVGSNFHRSPRLPAFCGERLWPIGGSRCINTDKSCCACARSIQTDTLSHGAQEGSATARDRARKISDGIAPAFRAPLFTPRSRVITVTLAAIPQCIDFSRSWARCRISTSRCALTVREPAWLLIE
jgi:hypothetical protein